MRVMPRYEIGGAANDTPVDVAIVGAGPYGPSIAAHLRAAGVGFRIFGQPMHGWLAHTPSGMLLKSEEFAFQSL
jgi:cation diffusion facilitator CzcD-associated flavoprotein CzcO